MLRTAKRWIQIYFFIITRTPEISVENCQTGDTELFLLLQFLQRTMPENRQTVDSELFILLYVLQRTMLRTAKRLIQT